MTSALSAGRAVAERTMTLTLTAYSPSGSTVTNDYKSPSFTNEGTTPGKIQSRTGGLGAAGDTTAQFLNIGGVNRPVLLGAIHIPIGADVPVAGQQRGKGWEYVVTAVGAADDPALLNRRYLVVAVPAKSFATARRLDVVEL